jgi:Tol biopolymer transport system component
MVIIVVLALGLATEVAKSDFTFGTPTNLGPTVNSSVRDGRPTISSDGLELFFPSERPGGLGDRDIYVTTRSTLDEPWGEPVNLGPPVNTSDREAGPDLSADDLSLFFQSDRPGGSGGTDLYVTTRSTKNDAWGTPVNLGPTVNSSENDPSPSISDDGLELFFHSRRSGGFGNADLYVTTRPTIDDDWSEPINLGSIVNTSNHEYGPKISPDRLTLFFFSYNRPGGYGSTDIWTTRRVTINDDWGEPINLGPIINSSSADNSPELSADGTTLYFRSNRPGGFGDFDLWQAQVIPIVDLNTDGIVDSADMCLIVDNWGTDNSLCDIGPMPWGDGIVDVQDLIILAEHLFEEFPPAEPVE